MGINDHGSKMCANYDYAYEAELCEKFHKRTPARVFDAHFHLSPNEIHTIKPENMFDTWVEDTEFYLGEGCLKGGLIMGNPSKFKTVEDLDIDRAFAYKCADEHDGYVNGLVTRPWDDPAYTEEWIRTHPKIAAIKPYRSYAQCEDTYEADITDYAPEWMWELAEKYGLVMMIHLSHYTDVLRHPKNIEQIRYLSKKYPNSKIILAHCGMGHNPYKMRDGLAHIKDLPNVWMDCGGISEPMAIIYCLKELGHERILFATDGYRFALGDNGRCMPAGGNFFGIVHPWIVDSPDWPPDYKYTPMRNLCEQMQALYEAGDLLGLTDAQWDDIFYNNAAKLFYPILERRLAQTNK